MTPERRYQLLAASSLGREVLGREPKHSELGRVAAFAQERAANGQWGSGGGGGGGGKKDNPFEEHDAKERKHNDTVKRAKAGEKVPPLELKKAFNHFAERHNQDKGFVAKHGDRVSDVVKKRVKQDAHKVKALQRALGGSDKPVTDAKPPFKLARKTKASKGADAQKEKEMWGEHKAADQKHADTVKRVKSDEKVSPLELKKAFNHFAAQSNLDHAAIAKHGKRLSEQVHQRAKSHDGHIKTLQKALGGGKKPGKAPGKKSPAGDPFTLAEPKPKPARKKS